MHPGSDLKELILAEADWLREQPGMESWERSCVDMVVQVDDWIRVGLADLDLNIDLDSEPDIDVRSAHPANRSAFRRRVLTCWLHNWRETHANKPHEDVRETAIQRIHGTSPDQRNLVQEAILVEAILQGNEAALREFDTLFETLAASLSRRVGTDFASDDEWRDHLRIRLIGAPSAPGALSGFVGKGSLEGWLRTVIRNELRNRIRQELQHRKAVEQIGQTAAVASVVDPSDRETTVECQALFQKTLRDVRRHFRPHQVAASDLVLGQGIKPADAARMLGKDRANVGRAISSVMDRIRETFLDEDGQFQSAFRDCAEHLFGSDDSSRAMGMLTSVFGPSSEAVS